jgi:hypothetical protein
MISHAGIVVRAEVMPDLDPNALRSSSQTTQSVEDGIPAGTVGLPDGRRSAEQPRDVLRLDQLARLVEVIVNDRRRVDPEGVVDRRQELAGVHRGLNGG